MGYYQVIGNNQGSVSDPGFMQNVVALGNAVGKNLNSKIFKDAADKNGLIPEIEDSNTQGIKIHYKSPQLAGRHYSIGKKTTEAGNIAQTIKDMLAKTAVANAAEETKSYGPELGGSVGPEAGAVQQPDGSLVDPQGNNVGEAPMGAKFPQPIGIDQNAVIKSALMKQAQDPAMAKAMGMPSPKSSKPTLDSDIAAAQAGEKKWAEVYRTWPTKIAVIQKAKNSMANVSSDKDTAQPESKPAAASAGQSRPAGAKYFSPSQKKYYDAQGNAL